VRSKISRYPTDDIEVSHAYSELAQRAERSTAPASTGQLLVMQPRVELQRGLLVGLESCAVSGACPPCVRLPMNRQDRGRGH